METNSYIEQKANVIGHRDVTESERGLKSNLEQKVSSWHGDLYSCIIPGTP